MKNIIKNIWFVSHKTGMYVTPYLWISKYQMVISHYHNIMEIKL